MTRSQSLHDVSSTVETPIASPGPDQAEESDTVGQTIAEFTARIESARTTLISAIGRDVAQPIVVAIAAARSAHDVLVQDLEQAVGSAEGEGPGSDPGSLRDEIRRYRQGVAQQIIDPLREALRSADIGRAIRDRWAEMAESLERAAARAPEEIARPEPVETYASAHDDGVLVGNRKRVIRVGRQSAELTRNAGNALRRVVRMSERPTPVRTQTVPLRLLLKHHVATRVTPSYAAQLTAFHQLLAAPVAMAERDLSSAIHALLDLEHELDAAQHRDDASIEIESPDGEAPAADKAAQADLTGITERARTAVGMVTAVLDAFRFDDAVAVHGDGLDAAYQTSLPDLDRDVLRVGTFMLDASERTRRPSPSSATRATGVAEAWVEWHRQAVARLDLTSDLSSYRNDIDKIVEEFNAGSNDALQEIVLRPIAECAAAMRSIQEDVNRACNAARGQGSLDELRLRLEQNIERSTRTLREHLVEPALGPRFRERVFEVADRGVNGVIATLENMPDAITLHLPHEPGATIDPDVRTIRVRPQEVAKQAFDAILLERVRTSVESLAVAVNDGLAEIARLESVIRFHLQSGIEEISADTEDGDAALSGAEELAVDGFDRTIEALNAQEGALLAQRQTCTRTLFRAYSDGWAQLHERIRVEDRMQEQFLDVGYRMRVALHAAMARGTQRAQQAARTGARLLRIGRGHAEELVRMGQTAVAGERITDEEKRRTVTALSQIDEMLAALPLVYRRLFTFQPVQDPGLLEGREADLGIVKQHYEHWRIGLTDALIITGYDGNGRTSFLNILASSVFQEADVRRLVLDTRILDETELATLLAGTLGITDDVSSLDELAIRLSAAPPAAPPIVCMIENLEHLFMRTARGNGLIGGLLGFMSRTDSRVCWIGTLAEQAWSYVEKVEAMRARLVRRHSLTALTTADLEAVISNRHARSGLNLDFQVPASTSPMLRRRLAKAPDNQERQRILRTEYFDQLARFAGQNLLLAIFYWLRSIEPDAESSSMRVRPVQPLSFGYMADLSLSQSFTLKAFLEHATLTLDEHDRIFETSREESRYLFESLGNLLLLESADVRERISEFTFTTVDADRRYRLRPLVVHPVLTHLLSKNLVL